MIFFLFSLVVAVSFCVEAIVGFGASVLIIALGANLYPIEEIIPLFAPVNWILSLYFSARGFSQIDTSFVMRRVVPWMGAGVGVGILFAASLSGPALKLLFALFVLGLSLSELHRIRAGKPSLGALSFLAEALWLLFAGFIYGIYTTGGPMVVYCASRRLDDKTVLRATLSSVWLIMSTAMILAMSLKGAINASTLQQSALLLPPLLAGIYAGEAAHQKLSGQGFKRLVYLLLLCAALFLLVSTLLR